MVSLPPLNASLYVLLHAMDAAAAAAVRAAGCRLCGGPLHQSTYPRKPRGLPCGAEAEIKRLSFCCGVEGCRIRHTPPSVLFFGRKVYTSAVLVLCCVGRGDCSPNVMRRLGALFGVAPRTVLRWRTMWRVELPQTTWWQTVRGLLPVGVDETGLPGAALKQFGRLGDAQTWVAFLRWIAPLTARSVKVL
jgi:hypothetical protein